MLHEVQPGGAFTRKFLNSQFTVAEAQIWGITEVLEGVMRSHVRKSPAGSDSVHIIQTRFHYVCRLTCTSQLCGLIRHTHTEPHLAVKLIWIYHEPNHLLL